MESVRDGSLMYHPIDQNKNTIAKTCQQNYSHHASSCKAVLTRKTFIVLSHPTDIIYLEAEIFLIHYIMSWFSAPSHREPMASLLHLLKSR